MLFQKQDQAVEQERQVTGDNMSKRADYCKRLLKKAFIIESNLGINERESVSAFIDEMGEHYDDGTFLVDDKNTCKCTNRSDVILMNDKNYCMDCFCIIKEIKDGKKIKEKAQKD